MIGTQPDVSKAPASVTALDQAYALSQRMRALAESQEWGQFSELQTQRLALLREIDGTLPDERVVRERLEALLSLNRELEQICVAARDRVSGALRSQLRNDNAIRSYRAMEDR